VHRTFRAVALTAVVPALALFAAPAANARPVLPDHHRIVAFNASSSNNWSGYNRGSLETGTPTLFSQVSSDWTVPTASQHTAGQAENSSTWIGIGGGCLNATCLATDNTLIQTGTEQDVGATGVATYSAWYELIPAPSIQVSLTVRPGDHIHADIRELVSSSNVWTITLTNTTTGANFTTTVPYSSTKGTVEWIEETPLLIGTNAGFSTMPNLSAANFDNARTNNATAALNQNEQINLVTSTGATVATPSAPDVEADGFNVCTFATTCAPPAS
jgi:hypothetical protein